MIQDELTQIELKIKKVCSNAQDELTLLLNKPESPPQEWQETRSNYQILPLSIDEQHTPGSVPFELILGSAEISSSSVKSLTLNEIISLTDVDTDQIQVCSQGVLIATGALLVINGKLAIRIEKVKK